MFIPLQPGSNYQRIGNQPLPKRIQVAQIIWSALIMGVLTFLGVTLMTPGVPQKPLIAFMGLGGAIGMAVLRFIVPGVLVRTQTKNLKAVDASELEVRLSELYQTKLIIGMALLEGAAFFNLVSYMAERQWWTLAVVGGLLLLMVSMFPSVTRFEAWAEDIKRNLQNQF